MFLLFNQTDKYNGKYIITTRIPKIIIQKKLLFLFTEFKNEWKGHKF